MTYRYKVGVLGVTDCHHRVNFLYQLLFLVVVEVHVPLGQASFTGSVLYQDKPNLLIKGNQTGLMSFLLQKTQTDHFCICLFGPSLNFATTPSLRWAWYFKN